MSKQRTQEQRKKIVDRCVEIEAEGGDVLAYLSTEGYVTPRATWLNMQKFDLNRKEFTDGKPVPGGRTKRVRYSDEERKQIETHVFEMLASGENPEPYLQQMGYAAPQQQKTHIIAIWKKTDPERYAAVIAARKPRKKNQITISSKPNPEAKKEIEDPQPVPDAMFRFIPLRDIRKMLKDEQARIGASDLRRCLEIEDDLRCIERVRQLGIEALRRASA